MKRLIWSEPARQDVVDFVRYYRDLSSELAGAMVRRIAAAPEILLGNPGIGTPLPDGRRKWRIRHTPLLLIYVAGEYDVEVLRVLHQASDWKSE